MSDDPSIYTLKVWLTFPKDQIEKPLIWEIIKTFDVVTNIRQASISHDVGVMGVEIDGPQERVESAVNFLRSRGVTVEPIEKNVIES
jgi:ABC-type methionine transport system ATPase subunit